MAFGIRCQSHGLMPVAFICPHLKEGSTFYHVCETPDIGLCGICFMQHGRQVKSIPEKNLKPICDGCFFCLKKKCEPVFNRLVETINEHS